MFNRVIEFSQSSSFFLFGARGTGKTYLLKERFLKDSNWYIDLLDREQDRRYILNPTALLYELDGRSQIPEYIIMDEVQKAPELLDLVHKLIEERKQKFMLSGSSARKLKRGAANLLAGRAFVYHLFPLTSIELDASFILEEALNWGTLPKLFDFNSAEDKRAYLKLMRIPISKKKYYKSKSLESWSPSNDLFM